MFPPRQLLLDVALPALAMLAALLLFGAFVQLAGVSAVGVWATLFMGAFGDWYSWQNTLQRAAPLMLTALCVAIPARAGLVVIGAEGALALGGLACAALPYAVQLPANMGGSVLLCLAGALAGAGWVVLVGLLRQWRGVNETISSLLLAYVAIGLFKHWVEGPLRDPGSLNKPSTYALAEGLRIGGIGGSDIHWGLAMGVVACLGLGLWLLLTPGGFALRVVGANVRAAQLVGLPVTRLVLLACALGGACAGLAGAVEVAAVHTNANTSLLAGYGYAGILVSFMARHSPLGIVPVAVLFGGFGAAGSLLQRRMGLPDASVLVLQGMAFVLILASEAWRGRLAALWPGSQSVLPLAAASASPASVAATEAQPGVRV